MALGDIALGQDDVIALDSPDGDLGLVELHTLLRATFFCDDHSEHRASL